MSTVVYIKASPRKDRSYSVAVADRFIAEYKKSHPADSIITLDIFKMDLPAFDGFALDAKYKILHGQTHTEEEKHAWKGIEKVIEQFKSADKYVMAVPMWNFGIPYRLKQYMDVIIQPGYTFSFSPEKGYEGLLSGKPALIIYARGGEYSGAPDMDFQKRYLELALGFIGIKDLHSIVVEPTLAGGPGKGEEKKITAIETALQLARKF